MPVVTTTEAVRALRRCLDSLLGEIQASLLRPPQSADPQYDALPTLLSRLGAASAFLPDSIEGRYCRALADDWRAPAARAAAGGLRRMLGDVLRCRDALQDVSASAALQQVIVDDIRTATDNLLAAPLADVADMEQRWCLQTRVRCRAIIAATGFLAHRESVSRSLPPATPRDLLRWMLSLEQQLVHKLSPAGLPLAFAQALEQGIQRCSRLISADELSQVLWQWQRLAGVLLVPGLLPGASRVGEIRWLCRGLLAGAAQALYQRGSTESVQSRLLQQVVQQALRLSGEYGDGAPGLPADLALTVLPDPNQGPVQTLLTIIPGDDVLPTAWDVISLHLYRLLVALRMLAGGFADTGFSEPQHKGLDSWQWLIACLYVSANHCVQQSVVTDEDRHELMALLGQLPALLQTRTDPGGEPLLRAALLLAARLGLRAQHHWQRLTLELDAAQQDFVGVPVQQVLAAELHVLPAMGCADSRDVAGVQPQHVLRDLRLLLKGARILNVQRIESLVLVMIELYRQMLNQPAFADAPGTRKVALRAHRSLCRMLDQAAVWQAPGNARRVINSLYAWLERWRGASHRLNGLPAAAVNERPASHHDQAWQGCLATNRRLRKLVRHQHDLDNIRALLLELLRSQEESIRRQVTYGTSLDAPQA